MRTVVKLSALAGVLFVAPVYGASKQDERATVVGEPLTLVVPSESSSAKCEAIKNAAAGTAVTVTQTFMDGFDRFDLADQKWLPHYDGGYDAATRSWLGADWGIAKRTLQGNHEQQLYVDPSFRGTAAAPLGLNPFSVKDGVLSITATPTSPELKRQLFNYDYASGLITSRASLVQTYGYFEMRARIPAGKALWPAFWLLGADKRWPPEIDVLEVVGQQPELMVTTTHYAGSDGKLVSAGCRTRLPNASEGFHNFGVLWTPERIVYYIDRAPVTQLTTPRGLDRPMYMLINLAVGGKMVGRADKDTPMPARLLVDWAAAYALPGYPACDPRREAKEMDRCWPK